MAFDRLVSLFCIVSENTPAMQNTLEAVGENTSQLAQTITALVALKDFSVASLFKEHVLALRVMVYVDAAIRIHGGLPPEGNPIVEIL